MEQGEALCSLKKIIGFDRFGRGSDWLKSKEKFAWCRYENNHVLVFREKDASILGDSVRLDAMCTPSESSGKTVNPSIFEFSLMPQKDWGLRSTWIGLAKMAFVFDESMEKSIECVKYWRVSESAEYKEKGFFLRKKVVFEIEDVNLQIFEKAFWQLSKLWSAAQRAEISFNAAFGYVEHPLWESLSYEMGRFSKNSVLTRKASLSFRKALLDQRWTIQIFLTTDL